jgi:DNA-binding MarR family transcriptional regulator
MIWTGCRKITAGYIIPRDLKNARSDPEFAASLRRRPEYNRRKYNARLPLSSFDLQRYLPYLLNRAAIRITEAFQRELRKDDLTVVMWRVLAVLWHDGAMRLGALAEATSIEVSTLSRLVTAMQARGLVSRTRSIEDARAVEVDLTAEGRAIAERIVPLALDYEATAIAGMSVEDGNALRRLLIQLYGNLSGLPQSAETSNEA